ncbi:GL15141 [Drosophila persimilis]|uniref:GL15141 n=1 Tax=Drosophila persimilis TaxID=7234 RepID=B4H3U0_DROPE|nr:GL15141 [Drosophila persimilis]
MPRHKALMEVGRRIMKRFEQLALNVEEGVLKSDLNKHHQIHVGDLDMAQKRQWIPRTPSSFELN